MPTDFVECENSWFDFRVTINGKRRWRHCGWAEDRPTARCALDEVVETMCPDACGTCGQCVDSTAVFRFDYQGDTFLTDCLWVAENDPDATCQEDGVALACRATCGLC